MTSTIGLKIANGEFYSVVEENSSAKKRLVLTTVHDKQRSVQIDLYKSYTRTMADALYIGSLVVENINPRPKGEPSIELVIASAENGEITADAVDLDPSVQGEHHTLNVSLKSLDEDDREYEIPDFELEHSEAPPTGLLGKATKARSIEKKKFPWLIVVCVILIIAAIALAIWLFFFRNGNVASTRSAPAQSSSSAAPAPSVPQNQPAAPAVQPQPAQTPEPEKKPEAAVTKVPVIEAPAKAPAASAPVSRKRLTPPVASYKVPSVIPKGGAPYKIRWGDTLWDIAGAFYRNPWLYPRIARFNNIRNPDLIIAGTTIRVPPKN